MEPVKQLENIGNLDPREAASLVAAAHEEQGGWLDEFAEFLDRLRAGQSLARTLVVWGLSQSEAARLFGVSRQAVSKWIDAGVPVERAETVADLAAATDLLVHYLKRDRIPAVVRRPSPRLGDRSLLDLLAAGETRELLAACREMFAFERAQS
jgi:transcriptional regulator with XRE-family HTH domain